jgi:hypothetical protein
MLQLFLQPSSVLLDSHPTTDVLSPASHSAESALHHCAG